MAQISGKRGENKKSETERLQGAGKWRGECKKRRQTQRERVGLEAEVAAVREGVGRPSGKG